MGSRSRVLSTSEQARLCFAVVSTAAQSAPFLIPQGEAQPLPLSPGAANFVAKIHTASGAVIVKIRTDERDSTDEERFALEHAPAKVGPELLQALDLGDTIAAAIDCGAFDDARVLELCPTQALILEFIEGETPTQATAAVLEAMAEQVAALHEVHPRRGPRARTGRSLSGNARTARWLLEELARVQLFSPTLAADLDKRLATLEAEIERSERDAEVSPCLCHGDLRLHNTMLSESGGLRLIDFEHSGIGHPAIDLALFRTRAPLSDDEELIFLDAYLERHLGRRRRGAAFESWLESYRFARGLAESLAALSGALDWFDVAEGMRRIGGSTQSFLDAKRAQIEEDLTQAFKLDAPFRLPTKAKPKVARRAMRGPAALALDGTAASGKSVLARAAADALLLPWRNTGAAFRYVALLALELGIDLGTLDDKKLITAENRLLAHVRRAKIALTDDGAVRACGQHIELSLEVFPIETSVAQWAQRPKIRRALAPVLARAIASPAVVEGRGLTSELFVDAPARYYIDASLPVRARRVWDRLSVRPSLLHVKRVLDARDQRDQRRSLEPLKKVRGVVVVDTTRGSEAKNIEGFLRKVRSHGAKR